MNVSDLKPLTTLQFDEAKSRAVKRVQRQLGERPTRKQFQRELGSLWTLLDVLALVVFIPALVISSIHIITHVGSVSAAAFDQLQQTSIGSTISKEAFVALHQWLSIPLAEGSMILFVVMFGLTSDVRRWVFLALAAVATAFLLTSNLSSGLPVFEAALAPVFTIGIGFKLEALAIQFVDRRKQVDEKYLSAMAVYEAATHDPTKHPDYLPYLANEIWTALMKPKGNQWAVEAPPGFKVAAVQRELSRERWAHEQPPAVMEFQPEEEVKVLPSTPFGSSAHGMEGRDGGSLGVSEMQLTTAASVNHNH